MAWYSIDMPEESVTDGGYHRFCRQFQKAFIGAGAPPEMALFACRDRSVSGRRLYLTPSSSDYVPDLVQYYGAEPCAVPESSTVTLVYGVPGSKTLLSTSGGTNFTTPPTGGPGEKRSVPSSLAPPQKKRELPAIYPIAPVRHAASNG